jgi:hypothetical protein
VPLTVTPTRVLGPDWLRRDDTSSGADKHDLRDSRTDDDVRDACLASSNDNRDPHTIVAPACLSHSNSDAAVQGSHCLQRYPFCRDIAVLIDRRG